MGEARSTNDELARARQFIKNNWEEMSDSEMGAVLGRTRSSVAQIRTGMALHRSEREMTAREAINAWYPCQECAKHCPNGEGCSRYRISRHVVWEQIRFLLGKGPEPKGRYTIKKGEVVKVDKGRDS